VTEPAPAVPGSAEAKLHGLDRPACRWGGPLFPKFSPPAWSGGLDCRVDGLPISVRNGLMAPMDGNAVYGPAMENRNRLMLRPRAPLHAIVAGSLSHPGLQTDASLLRRFAWSR